MRHFSKNYSFLMLKLDISKAVSQLNWKPVLDFKQAVKYTSEGYISDIVGNPAKESRRKTIQLYTKVAQNKKIPWSLLNDF